MADSDSNVFILHKKRGETYISPTLQLFVLPTTVVRYIYILL